MRELIFDACCTRELRPLSEWCHAGFKVGYALGQAESFEPRVLRASTSRDIATCQLCPTVAGREIPCWRGPVEAGCIAAPSYLAMTRASTAVTILLFVTKSVRMFSFGSTGVILALYLRELSFQDQQLGTLITLSLLGDSVISLAIILTADRFGRWKMLILGCGLKLVAGVMFALPPSRGFWELTLAATFGVLSPSGNEVGPFMALEQAILADAVNPAIRTSIFAWYNLAGYFASAAGAAESGSLVDILHKNYGWAMLQSYQAIFVQFSALALLSTLIFIFGRIPNKQQDEQPLNPYSKVSVGLSAASSQIVLQLSVLFAADSFAGSLVTGEPAACLPVL